MEYAKSTCPMCEKSSIDGMTHIRCKKPQGLDGLVSVWEYKGVTKKLIKAFKFRFAKDVSDDISKQVVKYIQDQINALPKTAYLVPIPLHKKRQNWRGFNQAEVLAKEISENTKWRLIPNLLIRVKQTKPQADLTEEERKVNVRGIFNLNPKYQIQNSKYPYILIDDVYTTGSTIREACKVLKRNGAKLVWGLTVAK
jgi:ComF family protein